MAQSSIGEAAYHYRYLRSISSKIHGLKEIDQIFVAANMPQALLMHDDDAISWKETIFGKRMTFSCYGKNKSEDCQDLILQISSQRNDTYNLQTLRFLPNDTVLDIGASAGVFAVSLARFRPDVRIIAVEPNAVAFRHLQRYVRQNQVSTQVEALQIAVTTDSRDVDILIDPLLLSAGTIYPGIGQKWTMGVSSKSKTAPLTARVSSSTITRILNERNLTSIYLLKLDCEGCEFEIIWNLPFSRIHVLRGEVHPPYAPSVTQAHMVYMYLELAGKDGRHPLNPIYLPDIAGPFLDVKDGHTIITALGLDLRKKISA
eukprot:TRINITY_DN10192_c0_g1::TRINITY_DN10192_c0_g1_i1::g.7618::m.7618 TRINITY_DN10192_c0_g1::TRINITY_DN10192_c0_g1_i1::g.7618  ORF type:complete len:316 (-),score=31.23,sp/A0A1B4XBG9/SDND_SORAA/25.00/2e-07,Methyltransf_21/PF05050.7/1.6e-10,Methyltransf_18/PF12847.2/1.3e-08,Met_10/PF02475.11/1.1e-08,MTS/PF05175.9/1.7e-06,Methyltransf_4/PF02390.12/0.0006,Methyltransf_26/PF13659.1/0.0012,PrmA/PF06325.8/0.0035,Methyltransf_22/PF13383.1/0.0071,Methyltransf_23/PF13489.1/0.0087,Methyltransf_31/PF13847.1/0.01